MPRTSTPVTKSRGSKRMSKTGPSPKQKLVQAKGKRIQGGSGSRGR